ncbi:helix-turn-helix domain-containing protein [Flavobacterium johnsoniae]|uniref:HTH araC/xylS-type domain-containing protein n=1 Tax=Flavobacterium johnsoniae TaxID=986 RepID=A0A1J7BMY2_FLAJO|nr:helix-turn-helix domain-containing protein [Flavobacterium johnsoniae]OIV40055.1 hypothetical protein BKM63_19040 [Flavobacterium johnsoniae]
MNFKLVLLLVSLSPFSSFSQDSEYDKIYAETSQVLLTSNPKQALKNTDYLYKISKNNTERINTYMLRAKLLRQYDINKEAIHSLVKADSLAKIDKNHAMRARINGFLSTLYREIGVPSIGSSYLKQAVNSSKKIEDKGALYRFFGNLCQELAYYEMYNHNYAKANTYLLKGDKFFSNAGPEIDKSFHLAVNNEIIAKNYLALHQIDSSLFFYEKAQKQLSASQSPDSPLKGFIYNGLGNIYTGMGNYETALTNYTEALKIAESSKFYTLRHEVYSAMLEYYKKTKNNKMYIAYNEDYLKMIESEEGNRKAIADNLIALLTEKAKVSHSKYQQKVFIIVGVSLLIILIIAGIYYYKRKQDYKKFKDYIIKKDEKLHTAITNPEKDIEEKKEAQKDYMSQETEESILKSIREFERGEYYLGKELSLNVMAAELGINHRYLSYVINKHKEKDFASYINELRINYIVDCLRADPALLRYKISYLADKCGFSSHSRFTITFKKVTGVSPLTFITYLKEEAKEKDIPAAS